LPGSPAIDAGNPSFDPNAFTPPLGTDQRGTGFPRVVNARIDIGAFEAPPPVLANLSITKVADNNPISLGDYLTYTITVTNIGPSEATNVTMSDTLPVEVAFFSATPSQGTCSGTTEIICALGSLANSASATVTIIVHATQTGTFRNTASVTATETDPDLTNNSASWDTTVNPVGGLPDLTGRWEIIGQSCKRSVCLVMGRFTVLNQSNQPVPAGVRVSFYLSSDSTFNNPGDPFLRQIMTSVPLNSSSDTASFNLSFPFVKGSALGKYVVAWVDPDPSSVQESNETNNALVSPQIQ
jgi:uncharacterized repeat protein (TIGR01451 family)